MDYVVFLHILDVLRAPKDKSSPWLNQPVEKKGLFFPNTAELGMGGAPLLPACELTTLLAQSQELIQGFLLMAAEVTKCPNLMRCLNFCCSK